MQTKTQKENLWPAFLLRSTHADLSTGTAGKASTPQPGLVKSQQLQKIEEQ